MIISNLMGTEGRGQRILVELRVRSRHWNLPDVADKLDLRVPQQADERLDAPIGMADREERQIHATAPSSEVQRAALVGGYVVGLVALDLKLRLVFRRMVGMPLVIEITRMDRDDRSRNAPGLRIPAHMVADLEPLRHMPPPSLSEGATRCWRSLARQRYTSRHELTPNTDFAAQFHTMDRNHRDIGTRLPDLRRNNVLM
jgi:hypothetical protein